MLLLTNSCILYHIPLSLTLLQSRINVLWEYILTHWNNASLLWLCFPAPYLSIPMLSVHPLLLLLCWTHATLRRMLIANKCIVSVLLLSVLTKRSQWTLLDCHRQIRDPVCQCLKLFIVHPIACHQLTLFLDTFSACIECLQIRINANKNFC